MERDYKFGDAASDAIIDLMHWISENTGLRGAATSGNAHLNVSATTVMITSSRTHFDHQSVLLDHIETDPRYKINSIGIKSISGGEKHPYLEVVEVE